MVWQPNTAMCLFLNMILRSLDTGIQKLCGWQPTDVRSPICPGGAGKCSGAGHFFMWLWLPLFTRRIRVGRHIEVGIPDKSWYLFIYYVSILPSHTRVVLQGGSQQNKKTILQIQKINMTRLKTHIGGILLSFHRIHRNLFYTGPSRLVLNWQLLSRFSSGYGLSYYFPFES